jgi:5'(3')-deoxyribonucleotidase
VHFKPGVFPGLSVWWNGRVSRDYMIAHHPLEYEELTGRPAVFDDHEEHAEEVSK